MVGEQEIDDDERELRIKGIMNRYGNLQPSAEQALAIWQMEEDGTHHVSGADHFSRWEEADYELDRWRIILDDRQFAIMVDHTVLSLQKYEQELIEQDAVLYKNVAFQQAYMDWLRKQFVPDFLRYNIAIPLSVITAVTGG